MGRKIYALLFSMMKARKQEMGAIYGAGAWQLGDILKNPAMEEAYQMGKSIC